MINPDQRHVTIKVTGNVQGVLYRRSARTIAEGLGINGYAENNLDGSVTIEAEGGQRAVDDFIRWCQVGPARAEVIHVEVEPGGLQHFTEFMIHSSTKPQD